MKTILCYLTTMIICLFELVDTIMPVFITQSSDADVFIDPERTTSILKFTFTNQLTILGIGVIFLIIGTIIDKKNGYE